MNVGIGKLNYVSIKFGINCSVSDSRLKNSNTLWKNFESNKSGLQQVTLKVSELLEFSVSSEEWSMSDTTHCFTTPPINTIC